MNRVKNINDFQKLKNNNEKIAMLTAYDYSTAKVLDEAEIDGILVGDSLAMVALGYENTYNITVDEMLIFIKAVARGAKNSFVVGDMPFMSYNLSIEQGLENAGKMIKAGANAVKIEGCNEHIITLTQRLTESGIPVLAHPTLYHMGKDALQKLVSQLKDAGLVALEAVYSTYSQGETREMYQLAEKNGLLISGGSDFHGSNKPGLELATGYHGKLFIPYDIWERLENWKLNNF